MKDKRKCKKPIHVSFDAGYGSPSAPTNFKSQYRSGLPLIRKLQIPWLSLTFHWPLHSFHWPFINEKQSMFTFTLAFFSGHRYFSLHFQPLSSFHGKREKELKESIHNKNHWPQLLQWVRCRVSNWLLCLPRSILFIFSERKCISKSWRKLMNYKPENRIPWPFTDFDDIKDFPWLFPDLEKFVFPWLFADHGNPAVTSQQISPLPQIIEYRETPGWFEFKCGQPQDITGLLFLQSGAVRCFCWGTCM